MNLRTAKFLKAVAEKARAEKRVSDMLSYESASAAFEVREKQVLTDLFTVMTRRANQGFMNLSSNDEPALKRIEIQTYLVKKGFTFQNTSGHDAVFWDTPKEELK